jgi:hypothetical protein
MHFSKKFWRKSCSNRGLATRSRPGRCHAATSRAPRAARGHPPTEAHLPHVPAPRGTLNPARHAPPRCHAIPTPCARRTAGPSVALPYARQLRSLYHGRIFAVTPSSPRPRPYLNDARLFLLAPATTAPADQHARHGRSPMNSPSLLPMGEQPPVHLP